MARKMRRKRNRTHKCQYKSITSRLLTKTYLVEVEAGHVGNARPVDFAVVFVDDPEVSDGRKLLLGPVTNNSKACELRARAAETKRNLHDTEFLNRVRTSGVLRFCEYRWVLRLQRGTIRQRMWVSRDSKTNSWRGGESWAGSAASFRRRSDKGLDRRIHGQVQRRGIGS